MTRTLRQLASADPLGVVELEGTAREGSNDSILDLLDQLRLGRPGTYRRVLRVWQTIVGQVTSATMISSELDWPTWRDGHKESVLPKILARTPLIRACSALVLSGAPEATGACADLVRQLTQDVREIQIGSERVEWFESFLAESFVEGGEPLATDRLVLACRNEARSSSLWTDSDIEWLRTASELSRSFEIRHDLRVEKNTRWISSHGAAAEDLLKSLDLPGDRVSRVRWIADHVDWTDRNAESRALNVPRYDFCQKVIAAAERLPTILFGAE